MKTKFRHTAESAAKAVRVLLADQIATTWEQYHDHEHNANAYTAAKLVQEQCNGPGKSTPVSYSEAAHAVAEAMPELFAEHWEKLAHDGILDQLRTTLGLPPGEPLPFA